MARSIEARLRAGVPAHLPASCRPDSISDVWIYGSRNGSITVCAEHRVAGHVHIIEIPARYVEAALAARPVRKRKAVRP